MRLIHQAAKVVLAVQAKTVINPKTQRELFKWTGKKLPPLSYFRFRPYIIPAFQSNKPINISLIEDYRDLRKEFGLIIVSKPVRNKWFKNQKVRYILTSKKLPRGYVCTSIPRDVKVQYDKANNRIRLIGRNVSPSAIGPWVYLDEEEI